MRGSRIFQRRVVSALILISTSSHALAADSPSGNAAASKPIPAATIAAIDAKAMKVGAPLYMRIFKLESELEVWMARADGRYLHVKTFPICTWSGDLGPKEKVGDLMSPEGFYAVSPAGLKPDSKYHLALNVGYPNALDRTLGRTGDFIMVHGKCDSVGCFAMTDDLIEEIYALARTAIENGQVRIPVHIFPFRMTKNNLGQYANHPARASWAPLKVAYDDFARTLEVPRVAACGNRYVVNPLADVGEDPAAACPPVLGRLLSPVSPRFAKKLKPLNAPLIAEGIKTRAEDGSRAWAGGSMLGAAPGKSAKSTPAKPSPRSDADIGALVPLLPPR